MPSFKLLTCFKCIVVVSGLVVLAGLGFIYSGYYPMGADSKHTKLTYWALETLRERSISRAAQNIEVPADLDILRDYFVVVQIMLLCVQAVILCQTK